MGELLSVQERFRGELGEGRTVSEKELLEAGVYLLGGFGLLVFAFFALLGIIRVLILKS